MTGHGGCFGVIRRRNIHGSFGFFSILPARYMVRGVGVGEGRKTKTPGGALDGNTGGNAQKRGHDGIINSIKS